MNSFYGCSNMDVKASDVPDLSLVQDLSGMFSGATSLKGESANWAWDTSNVKYTDTMFVRASNFNQNIGSWDMSNVESMTRMFNDAAAFNNGGSSSISGILTRMMMIITFRMVRHFFFGLTGLVGLTGTPEVFCGTPGLARRLLLAPALGILLASPFFFISPASLSCPVQTAPREDQSP